MSIIQEEQAQLLDPSQFFDLTNFKHNLLFKDDSGYMLSYVWLALQNIQKYLSKWFSQNEASIKGHVSSDAHLENNSTIFIGEGSYVEPGAYISGPTIIGKNCTIRHGAYIRGNVILGDNVIIGHATEVKNSILLNGAQAPHFSYVGDSIIGSNVNLGAGTKLSNLTILSKKDALTKKRPTLKIKINGAVIDTSLSKLGAILGDNVQIGCNAVTNPGCIIGKNTMVYANVSLSKGLYAPNQIIKLRQSIDTSPLASSG